jgi:hypothetical protein
MAAFLAFPARRSPAGGGLANCIAAGGAVVVAVTGIRDAEARTASGLPADQAECIGGERGNERLEEAAAGGDCGERASQRVKARAIHRVYSST